MGTAKRCYNNNKSWLWRWVAGENKGKEEKEILFVHA
jgi:hypothetical protein